MLLLALLSGCFAPSKGVDSFYTDTRTEPGSAALVFVGEVDTRHLGRRYQDRIVEAGHESFLPWFCESFGRKLDATSVLEDPGCEWAELEGTLGLWDLSQKRRPFRVLLPSEGVRVQTRRGDPDYVVFLEAFRAHGTTRGADVLDVLSSVSSSVLGYYQPPQCHGLTVSFKYTVWDNTRGAPILWGSSYDCWGLGQGTSYWEDQALEVARRMVVDTPIGR